VRPRYAHFFGSFVSLPGPSDSDNISLPPRIFSPLRNSSYFLSGTLSIFETFSFGFFCPSPVSLSALSSFLLFCSSRDSFSSLLPSPEPCYISRAVSPSIPRKARAIPQFPSPELVPVVVVLLSLSLEAGRVDHMVLARHPRITFGHHPFKHAP